MGIPIAHVESGLRSFDRTMPEEINRLVTDVLADFLFVTEPAGLVNLRNEGIADEKVFFTGNVMIDSLRYYLPRISASGVLKELDCDAGQYILVTFHRPSNVDTTEGLKALVDFLNRLAEEKKVVFPVHPRTRKNIEAAGLKETFHKRIIITEPIGYIDFLALTRQALMVITDSGGIQEETTWLGIPCITVRQNTERPVTVETGTNYLAGTDFGKVNEIATSILAGKAKKGRIPELWDGNAAGRIVDVLLSKLLSL
jgi:UDP-N-acetylglucosamine 2-epimerase (non-hydrolysing)